MPAYIFWLQLVFAALVIFVFGYRQFNSWTAHESSEDESDSELLAYAPPRSFTPFWRFVTTELLYCVALVVMYFVLFGLLRSDPANSSDLLKLTGVTQDNAWLFALFIVTGLAPIVPWFAKVEHAIREATHFLALVPFKAQQLADELSSPTTTFELDEDFLLGTMIPKLAPTFSRLDFAEGRANTIAQKWCRLQYLREKFAPPALKGSSAHHFHTPYFTRLERECEVLGREVAHLAATPMAQQDLLRMVGGSPASVGLAERIDRAQHHLYVLMCCRAFAKSSSLDEVVRYFRKSYGIGIGHVELASARLDPIFDTLVGVTAAVVLISLGYILAHPADNGVHPIVWGISAFCTHGAGVVVGWFVFARYKAQAQWSDWVETPVSRLSVLASVALSFALASIPTFAITLWSQYLKGAANGPWLDVAIAGMQRSWPWAFLGSATAAATYFHLVRNADRATTIRMRVGAAVTQALVNVCIGLLILTLHTQIDAGPPNLWHNLEQPILQLVLALTATIGLVLGFFLPRAVYGHGLDQRAGVERHNVDPARAPAVFTYGGKQLHLKVRSLSMSGALLELNQAGVEVTAGHNGVLTLHDKTALTVYVARLLNSDDPTGAPLRFAVRLMSRRGRVVIAPGIADRLRQFLAPQAPQEVQPVLAQAGNQPAAPAEHAVPRGLRLAGGD